MTIQQKYRQIIAAILLTVYAFIAMPVSLWHHHHISEEKQHTNHSGKDEIAQSAGAFSEAGCAVCAHKYSAYHGDIIIPELLTVIIYNPSENGYYIANPLSPSCFLFSNKSPPVKA
ncbi:MAG: hypothetical protein KF862_07080 [Chitinophagaceae bacterium]|nr:hypothetical protein [Chitinophagaceae bacterium]